MKQYNAIWPLPGGVENYFKALQKIVRHVQENEPLREKMVEDYRVLFPGTDKEHVIGTQLLIPVHLGFVEISAGKFRITKDGAAFLQKPDVFGLYRKIAEAHLGFNEIVLQLEKNSISLRDIHAYLQENVNNGWSNHSQPSFRVNWLRSLGFVKKEGGAFHLTEQGKKLASEIRNGVVPPVVPPPITPPIVPPPPEKTPAERLKDRLIDLAIASDKPAEFEDALAEAFAFLGFDARKIGGSGEPDVVIHAPLGPQSYTVVVDAKTTARGSISQSHVNLNALLDHKKKANADHVAVVAVAFSGDNLPKWAFEQNVRLIEIETLAQIITRHEATPFSLVDLKPLFEGGGPIEDTSVADELSLVADEIDEALSLPAKIFRVLLDKQTGCKARLDEHSLYFLLDEEHEVADIQAALDFLRSPSVDAIVEDAARGLATRYGVATFRARMKRLAELAEE